LAPLPIDRDGPEPVPSPGRPHGRAGGIRPGRTRL